MYNHIVGGWGHTVGGWGHTVSGWGLGTRLTHDQLYILQTHPPTHLPNHPPMSRPPTPTRILPSMQCASGSQLNTSVKSSDIWDEYLIGQLRKTDRQTACALRCNGEEGEGKGVGGETERGGGRKDCNKTQVCCKFVGYFCLTSPSNPYIWFMVTLSWLPAEERVCRRERYKSSPGNTQHKKHVKHVYTIIEGETAIPYSRKYWRSLNLAVVLCSVIRHYEHCERVYQGALPSSCLRYLNKSVSSQIYKKYNWQHVNDELAIRTACEKGRRTGPRALQHVLCLTHCRRGQHNIGGF